MGISPLYKKYGAGADPGMALVESQRAVGEGFKEALAGVDKLLQQAEQGYIEKNTTNLQQYLKSNVQGAGLGADTPDLLDIKQKFGKLVNMETLDKTIQDTRDKMVNDALDDASGFAGQKFGKTEDIAEAGNAFKQRLLSLGMKEMDANKHVATWRQDNQYLAEDVKIRDNQLLENFKNSALSVFASHGGAESTGDVTKAMAEAQLPEKLRTRGILETRELFDKVAGLSEVDKGELATAHQRIDQQSQAEIGQIDLQIQQQKDLVKQMGGVPLGIVEAVRQKNAEMGGLPNAIKKDVENNTPWYRRWFDNVMPGKDLDEKLSQHLQSKVMDIVDSYGLDMDTAAAISLQAYNDFGGVMPQDPNALDARMAGYLDQEIKRKDALQKVMSLEAAGLSRKNALLDRGTQLKQELLSRAQLNNMQGGGGSITKDFENNFRSKLGGGAVATEQEKPTANKPAGSAASVGGYDISRYATDPNHETAVAAIYEKMPAFNSPDQIDFYIKETNPESPITGDMVLKAAQDKGVDPRMLMSIMQQDSSLGTAGKGARTNNPGNVGNDDTGKEVTFATVQEGVNAVADWLSKNKVQPTLTGDINKDREAVLARLKANAAGGDAAAGAPAKVQATPETSASPGRPQAAGVGNLFTGLFNDAATLNKKQKDNVTASFKERVNQAAAKIDSLPAADKKKYLAELDEGPSEFAKQVREALEKSKKAKS